MVHFQLNSADPKTLSKIIFFILSVLVLCTAFPVFSAEAPADQSKPAFLQLLDCHIPEIIVRLPDSEITRQDLFDAVYRQTLHANHPIDSVFLAPERMITSILQMRQAAKSPERLPSAEELRKFLEQWQKFEHKPGNSNPLISQTNDAFRDYILLKITDVTGINPFNTKQFNTKWYGVDKKIIASITGKDYTRNDLARYLITWCSDRELEVIIEELVQRRIIQSEAMKMDIPVNDKLTTREIAEKIFAPLVSEQALTDFYTVNKEKFSLLKVKTYSLDFMKNIKKNGDKLPAEEITKAKKLALQKMIDFSEALKTGKETHQAQQLQEDYLYLSPDPDLVTFASPEAYGIDFIYTENGKFITPITRIPKWLDSSLSNKRPGLVLGPFETESAIIIAVVINEHYPRRPEMIYNVLREKRLLHQSRRLFESIKNISKFYFRPNSRINYQILQK